MILIIPVFGFFGLFLLAAMVAFGGPKGSVKALDRARPETWVAEQYVYLVRNPDVLRNTLARTPGRTPGEQIMICATLATPAFAGLRAPMADALNLLFHDFSLPESDLYPFLDKTPTRKIVLAWMHDHAGLAGMSREWRQMEAV